MTDIDDLWPRIDEARRRLGAADQARIRQLERLIESLKAMHAGFAGRLSEVDRLRGENEHLRNMLYNLLLAIEERYGGRMKDLLKDLEEQVCALIALGGDKTANPAPVSPHRRDIMAAGEAEKRRTSGVARAKRLRLRKLAPDLAAEIGGPATPSLGSEMPDEGDSRWLKQIMERAREFSAQTDADGPAASRAIAPPRRSASI